MNTWLSQLCAAFAAWLDKLYETFVVTNYYTTMLDGLKNTVIITLGALLIGVVLGYSAPCPVPPLISLGCAEPASPRGSLFCYLVPKMRSPASPRPGTM